MLHEPVSASTQALTFSQAIQVALRDEMQRDPRVILIGEGVRHSGPYRGLVEEFGHDRVLEAPIAEQGFTCAGIGAALMGLRPVVAIGRGDFLYPAMDSIVNEAAKYRYICGGGNFRVPMVIKVHSTGMGGGAGTQHAQSVEATFMHVPGLKIAIPSTPTDALGLFRAAVRDDNPVLFFEHREIKRDSAREDVPLEPAFAVPFGKAAVRRSGTDVTLVSYGYMAHKCFAAAEELATRGMSAEVIDLRTVLPWDRDAVVNSVRRTGRLVVVTEDCRRAGVGAEIAATVGELAFPSLKAPIQRVTYPDMPVPGTLYAESLFLIQVDDILNAVDRLV